MSFIEKLNWRYATKKFDSSKNVSVDNRNKIMEAIRMAPTSFGFQPFHVKIVESKPIREELKKSAWNQQQFIDAPLLFVFSVRSDLSNRIEEYINLMTGADAVKKTELKQYEDMMKGAVSSKNEAESRAWAAKQAYIALGFGLSAALELDLDSCPMEGFDADAFKKILELPDNLYPVVSLAVGYRSTDDVLKPKVRFPNDDLFSTK
jgi:nitroreductase